MVLAFAVFVPVMILFAEKNPWIVFLSQFVGLPVVVGSVYLGVRLMSPQRG